MEPDHNLHYFFEDYADAILAWLALQGNENIPLDIRQEITSPRQTYGGWIFDKETQWQ